MSLVLKHPVVTPLRTVTLPSPEQGDNRVIEYNTLKRRTRAGAIKGLRDTSWPIIEIFTYNFRTIIKSVIADFRDFLTISAGLEIEITDHLSVVRTGVILTPEPEVIVMRDDCSYDVSFQFRKIS